MLRSEQPVGRVVRAGFKEFLVCKGRCRHAGFIMRRTPRATGFSMALGVARPQLLSVCLPCPSIERGHFQRQRVVFGKTTVFIGQGRIGAAFEQQIGHRNGAHTAQARPAVHVLRIHIRAGIEEQAHAVE